MSHAWCSGMGSNLARSGEHKRLARVLIVDDERSIADVFRRVLAHENEVFIVCHPIQALEKIKSGAWFDAILSDLAMPVLSGLDLWRAVTGISPEQAERFIFVTATPSETALEGLAVTLCPVLEKPVSIGLLRRVVEQVAWQRGAEKAAG
jgi:two-component system capsular synthesis sensor histidine kinase RcsC